MNKHMMGMPMREMMGPHGGQVPGKMPMPAPEGMDTDTVDAKLTPGEFVLNREAVAMIGEDKLKKWNEKGLGMRKHMQKFADGGQVDDKVYKDVVQQDGHQVTRFGDSTAVTNKQVSGQGQPATQASLGQQLPTFNMGAYLQANADQLSKQATDVMRARGNNDQDIQDAVTRIQATVPETTQGPAPGYDNAPQLGIPNIGRTMSAGPQNYQKDMQSITNKWQKPAVDITDTYDWQPGNGFGLNAPLVPENRFTQPAPQAKYARGGLVEEWDKQMKPVWDAQAQSMDQSKPFPERFGAAVRGAGMLAGAPVRTAVNYASQALPVVGGAAQGYFRGLSGGDSAQKKEATDKTSKEQQHTPQVPPPPPDAQAPNVRTNANYGMQQQALAELQARSAPNPNAMPAAPNWQDVASSLRHVPLAIAAKMIPEIYSQQNQAYSDQLQNLGMRYNTDKQYDSDMVKTGAAALANAGEFDAFKAKEDYKAQIDANKPQERELQLGSNFGGQKLLFNKGRLDPGSATALFNKVMNGGEYTTGEGRTIAKDPADAATGTQVMRQMLVQSGNPALTPEVINALDIQVDDSGVVSYLGADHNRVSTTSGNFLHTMLAPSDKQ